MEHKDLWWIPLASVLAGGLLAILGGVFSQWITSSLKRRERLNDFQRQTLLDLQADLNHISRAIAHRHERGEDYTNEWRRLTILIERVEDDEIRQLVTKFKTEAAAYETNAMDQTFQKLNHRIGTYLRSL
jgi:predicted  nucleic acid-binding Zn-ribbon protein